MTFTPHYIQFEHPLGLWENADRPSGNRRCAGNRVRHTHEWGKDKLTLTGLRLRSLPPVMSALSNMRKLYLDNCRLTHLPSEMSPLRLRVLSARHNQLERLPGWLWGMTDLTHLIISDNLLTKLSKKVGRLDQLQELEAYNNRIASLPSEIGQARHLKRLNLSNTGLATLPNELCRLANLKRLSLSSNQLRELPSQIGQLAQLQHLYLDDNPELRSLPLSALNLSQVTHFNRAGSGISLDDQQRWFRAWRSARVSEATALMPESLALWQGLAGKEYDLSFISEMTEPQQGLICEWLLRLSLTQDYSRHQQALATTVCRIMRDLGGRPEFQESFFAQIEDNLACCEDRAAMALNELYTTWLLYTVEPSAAEGTKSQLKLLAGVARTLKLRKVLAQMISEKGGSNESVEIYLYYETRMRRRLRLVTAIEKMSHKSIGRRKWIDKAALQDAVWTGYMDELLDLPMFEKIAARDESFRSRKASIEREYEAKLDDASDPDLQEAERIARMNTVMKDRQKALHLSALDWASGFLEE